MESVAKLFEGEGSSLFQTYIEATRNEKKINSERAELISFFVDNLKDKKGEPFKAKMIAIKLSHLSVSDIRYMISIFKDIEHRKGNDAAAKWFWWSIKPKK